jgi:hypothetical protein
MTPADRLLVVVPLKEGARERAARLFEKGPPFDPRETRLDEHLTFLTDSEAIFLFESVESANIERLLDHAQVWASAEEWRELLAGPPRVAQPSYAWTRHQHFEEEGLSFESTPGPGDSEGGDVYAP